MVKMTEAVSGGAQLNSSHSLSDFLAWGM